MSGVCVWNKIEMEKRHDNSKVVSKLDISKKTGEKNQESMYFNLWCN